MRDAQNIHEVELCGADWMGFIFFPTSARNIVTRPEYLPVSTRRVGVFVNANPEDITARAQEYGLDFIQLHGTESPELCDGLKRQGLKIIKAFSVQSPDDFLQTNAYVPSCDYFLFDTPCKGYGGSGQQFDWDLLQHYHGQTPFLLSGGIRPESLEALSAFHHPSWAGIDLNSGFETPPGYKNIDTLKTFIKQFKTLQL